MLETVSLIWQNPNNQMIAIKALIDHPKTSSEEIDSILKRTQSVWERIFTKIVLVCRVLFSKSYQVRFGEASEKLRRMMDKVAAFSLNAFMEVYSEEKTEIKPDRLERARINHQYQMCDLAIKVRLENEPLIDAFDQKSLLLQEIEGRIASQTLVKGGVIQKVKSLKKSKKMQVQEEALHSLEEKAANLKAEIEELRKKINENLGKVFNFEHAYAKIEFLEKMREELKQKLA